MLQTGGTIQLLQLWINLPEEKKQLDPSFRHYDSSIFPIIETENTWVKVIIGSYEGKESPISTHTPMFLYHIKIQKGQLVTIPVREDNSAAAYVMQGKLKVLGKEPVAGELVNFNMDGNQVVFTAIEDSEVLMLGGEPIKEKVVSYGPFVMNSFEEIQGAISAYESGKMGVLEF